MNEEHTLTGLQTPAPRSTVSWHKMHLSNAHSCPHNNNKTVKCDKILNSTSDLIFIVSLLGIKSIYTMTTIHWVFTTSQALG